jgi:hypothetical protein
MPPSPSVRVPNQPSPGGYIEDFFVYEANTLGLAAGLAPAAVYPVNINIQADSDFKLVKLTQFANNHAAVTNLTESTRPLPLVTIQMVDTGSGRNLFSGPVPIPGLFGDGRIPFILPIIRIFKASATITVTFTNYDTAITYDVYLQLIGTKLFRGGANPYQS